MSGDPDLRTLLLADVSANWRHRGRVASATSWFDVARSLGDVRFVPVVLIRLGTAAADRRSAGGKIVSQLLSMANRVIFGVESAPQTRIGAGLYLPHTNGIVIGAAQIGARCVIYHQVTLGAKTIDMAFTPTERPIVGDDVTIAAGAKVLGGVRIGDGAVIAANAVVVDDVARGTLVGGVPAVELRPPAP